MAVLLFGVCKFVTVLILLYTPKQNTTLLLLYIFAYSFKNQKLQFHFQCYTGTICGNNWGKTSALKHNEYIDTFIPNLLLFIQVSLCAVLYKIGIMFYPFWFWSSLFRDLSDPILPSIFTSPPTS